MEDVNNTAANYTMRNIYIYTVTALLLILVSLIFIRERKGNYYTLTAEEVHQLSLNNSLYIHPEDIHSYDNSLTIKILEESEIKSESSENHLQIYPAELLQHDIRKKIKNYSGTILLKSNNEILLANAWYILSRKGFENIKIAGFQKEELLYKFQPDSSAGLK